MTRRPVRLTQRGRDVLEAAWLLTAVLLGIVLVSVADAVIR